MDDYSSDDWGERRPLLIRNPPHPESQYQRLMTRFKMAFHQIPMAIFYFFCCLSGQLTTNCSKRKYGYCVTIFSGLSVVFSLLLLLANVGSLAFNMYVVGACPYKGCSYFCSKYYNSHDLLDAYLRSTLHVDVTNGSINHTLIGGLQPESREEYSNWNKVVITTATLAGFLSYYMMIILVLIPVYTKVCCCLNKEGEKIKTCLKTCCSAWQAAFKHEQSILLPFCDTDDIQSTALNGIQNFFFVFFYFLNLLLFFSSLAVFVVIMKSHITDNNVTHRDINESGLTFQFLSQFCAIQSCFIFSKVAYGISNKCNKVIDKFKQFDVSDAVFDRSLALAILPEYRNQARLNVLKKIDSDFIADVKSSIIPYGHWFAFHWVLYTITTFMSLAFLAETYIRFLYLPHSKLWLKDQTKVLNFSYIALFFLTHTFLFVYPCFRAAQITSSRAATIKAFVEHRWRYLPLTVQSSFHSYLEAQNFGFRISFFCTELTFSFNLAFVSIFIGGFGVIMKLSL